MMFACRIFRAYLVLVFLSCIVTFAHAAQGNPERGKAIYGRHCSMCHGPKGDGTSTIADYLEDSPADFLSLTSRQKSDQELFNIIQFGSHLEMIGWERILTEQEIWDAVSYIRVLAPYVPPRK